MNIDLIYPPVEKEKAKFQLENYSKNLTDHFILMNGQKLLSDFVEHRYKESLKRAKETKAEPIRRIRVRRKKTFI